VLLCITREHAPFQGSQRQDLHLKSQTTPIPRCGRSRDRRKPHRKNKLLRPQFARGRVPGPPSGMTGPPSGITGAPSGIGPSAVGGAVAVSTTEEVEEPVAGEDGVGRGPCAQHSTLVQQGTGLCMYIYIYQYACM